MLKQQCRRHCIIGPVVTLPEICSIHCTYRYMYIHINIRTSTYIYICVHIYTYVYMYVNWVFDSRLSFLLFMYLQLRAVCTGGQGT